MSLLKNVSQTLNLDANSDALAHYAVLGLSFLLLSYILSTITVNDWAVDGVRILLLLGVLILGLAQAVLIINNSSDPQIHTLSWLLIIPLIVYLFQSQLNTTFESRVNLWLLLILVGGAFYALFLTKTFPMAIYAFYGLLAAGVLLEVYQVARSSISQDRQAMLIVFFLSWLFYGLPFVLNMSISTEIYWGLNDLFSIVLFLYFLLYAQ